MGESPTSRWDRSWARWLMAAGLAVGTAWLYWPAVGYEFFTFDDPQYVSANPRVLGGLTWANVLWALGTGNEAGLWLPLTWLSLQLDATLWGPGPAGFHRTNVLLHAANSAVVFAVLVRLTGAAGPAAVAAAAWAAHPLRVESVAWVTERKDVLSGLFGLLAVLAHLRSGGRSGGRVTALFAAAVAAKPMLVTLPAVLVLLDFWPLGRVRAAADGWAAVRRKWPLWAVAAGAAAATVAAQREVGALSSADDLPAAERAANAAVGYAVYLGLTGWPHDLAPFYPLPADARPAWQAAAAAAGVAAITAATVWAGRAAPYLAVGWLWFAGTLLPVSGLVQAGEQAYADRFTYFPHVGLAVAAAGGAAAARRLGGGWRAAAACGLSVGVLVAAAAATRHQLGFWRAPDRLWERVVAVSPDAGTAWFHLGELAARRNDYPAAEGHFARAGRLDPTALDARAGRAEALFHLGRLADAEADARTALALPHRRHRWYEAAALHVVGEAARRRGELAAAEGALRRSAELFDRAIVRAALGAALGQLGRPAEAAEQFARAHAANPAHAPTAYLLGAARLDAGDPAAAVGPLRTAVDLAPVEPRYRTHLGVALVGVGRLREAAEVARGLAAADPGWVAATARTANALLAHPDPSGRRPRFAGWLADLAALAGPDPPAEVRDAQAAARAALSGPR